VKNSTLLMCVVTMSCCFSFSQAQYKVLWNFSSAPNDGAYSEANLVFDGSGNLYGTTFGGGNPQVCASIGGCGTVFELSPNSDGTWTNSVIYNFCSNFSPDGCLDGQYPEAGLVFDSSGNLYGTTVTGGGNFCPFNSGGCGTVFELSPPKTPGAFWSETVLYAFCSVLQENVCLDGAAPVSQVVLDSSGNVIGTTSTGGSGHDVGGTVFKLTRRPDGWTESVLYSFCSLGQGEICPDGSQPMAGVTFDKVGNLYGTTQSGGSPSSHGEGTAFKLSQGASGWTETVLYSPRGSGLSGGGPDATVSFDSLGNLYSTFSAGGAGLGGGVFKLARGGRATAFSFDGKHDAAPMAGVLVDFRNAVLYGTTSGGRVSSGTIYKLTAPAQETVLYNFCSQPNCSDGGDSVASLIADRSGNLYGTTKLGGTYGFGVVFEVVLLER